jgi:hypothetical protein
MVGLQGCVPWVYPYERIQAPQAVYYRSWCRGIAGPPFGVYYPLLGSGELTRGTIKLPPITVNGIRYEEQVLSFKHASCFDLFNPVNC